MNKTLKEIVEVRGEKKQTSAKNQGKKKKKPEGGIGGAEER